MESGRQERLLIAFVPNEAIMFGKVRTGPGVLSDRSATT